eukprot:CAMPEP_0170610442 /NCGR_PEP_ID=MMETSP0224-20130122/22662_1 /TAXON_ID=285029 /ORGANISM="Togula jolla, Strain CCCM 725" /LENGTH=93 /DNA_ID=CAMNT_0010935819 /DNA_START=53 /DNA_END=334 /DNA_ORIENTATION=+
MALRTLYMVFALAVSMAFQKAWSEDAACVGHNFEDRENSHGGYFVNGEGLAALEEAGLTLFGLLGVYSLRQLYKKAPGWHLHSLTMRVASQRD